MAIDIGHVEAIFRYPVKSMAGSRLESATLGWHGLDGDRRFALRRVRDRGEFPWLTASKLPDLLRFTPLASESDNGTGPTHVRTPDGAELPIFGEELAAEVERRHGAPVQMMELRHGIFDEAAVSVISGATVSALGEASGITPDVRRFRPNIVVRLPQPGAFQEDRWVGGILWFGEEGQGPGISVTMRDIRCSMVNFDPDTARAAPAMLKTVVRLNENNAGVYGSVIRTGTVSVGQPVRLGTLPRD
jgi:uncharacterized protein YcbX